jgi:hypothetical protein
MTKAQFDALYEIKVQETHQPYYSVKVSVIERATGKVVMTIPAGHPTTDVNQIAGDSQHTLNPMTPEYIKELLKRYALDMVAKAFGITDWFPLDMTQPLEY